jgi:hypothetical protein
VEIAIARLHQQPSLEMFEVRAADFMPRLKRAD